MGTFNRAVVVLSSALALALVSAGSVSADAFSNPGQWWHSANLGKASFTGSGGNNLYSHPAQACFGQTGWIGADYSGSLQANQTYETRAHAKGTVEWTFWVNLDPTGLGPHDYEGHATLEMNTLVEANLNYSDPPYYSGYKEYVFRVDMTPVGGGSTIAMNWPVQIWASWSPEYTGAGVGLGLATCA